VTEDSSFEGWTSPLPTGWQLETETAPQGSLGTIRVLQPASEALVRSLKRRIREIPEEQLTQDGSEWVDESSGERFELVTSFVDYVDPKVSGVTAFTIRGECILMLRPVDSADPREQSVEFGDMAGRRVT
jgi:hypothetical protein